MSNVIARRLRVRDDGTGKSGPESALLDDFQDEDAIVVLGNPGMGKTTLFQSISNVKFSSIRRFLAAPEAIPGTTLFLDSLDEYRTLTKGQDVSLKLAEVLQSLGRPRFRISCRAADWYGSTDLEVLRDASASGRVVVLELLALTHEEIVAIVSGQVADPTTFIAEAQQAGVADLLGNPQTLDLIAKAWRTKNRPQNKHQAFHFGVDQLVREMNPIHAEGGLTSFGPSVLRAAAAAAASTVLLSNIAGISRNEAATTDDYVHLSAVAHSNLPELASALGRRVFHSPDAHRFELVHRTVAEFLAAEDLLERIRAGLPIDRVLALICGSDGKPVASLRGLFAWLMSRDSTLSISYATLDAYAVATYGDCSVLSPDAQRALLVGLCGLSDPWFLSNESDRSSFRGLANENTKNVILDVLREPNTEVHAKITMLKAISNGSSKIADFAAITKQLVLNKNEGLWLRATATEAYVRSVGGDSQELESLDESLAKSEADENAGDVRISLLRESIHLGQRTDRIVSIVRQVAGPKEGIVGQRRRRRPRIVGRLYALSSMVQDSDLQVILDRLLPIVSKEAPDWVELRSLYDTLLSRRLARADAIDADHLSRWLLAIGDHRHSSADKVLNALAELFRRDADLFDRVFDRLSEKATKLERMADGFPIILWRVLPIRVWPVNPAAYLIEKARKEPDVVKATELFRHYMSTLLPDAPSTLTDLGFEFLSSRNDVSAALGGWTICEVPTWVTQAGVKRTEELTEQKNRQHDNVKTLTEMLPVLRDGSHERALTWATQVYFCMSYDLDEAVDGKQRLIDVTNEALAEAILEGFTRYIEHEGIPTQREILQAGSSNSTPVTHTLVALSTYLRLVGGFDIPGHALPSCVAAAISNVSFSSAPRDFDDVLLAWLKLQFDEAPKIVTRALGESWKLGAKSDWLRVQRFYELKDDKNLHPLLGQIAADVLEDAGNCDLKTVRELLPFLMYVDARRALQLAEDQASRPDLPIGLKALWETALFVLGPRIHETRWASFVLSGPDFQWETLALLSGSDSLKIAAPTLTLDQRRVAIEVIGRRFGNTPMPTGTWSGRQHAWDASNFVGAQIEQLSASESDEGERSLDRILAQPELSSYHLLIRHQLAQRARRMRDLTFSYASPAEIADALRNKAPATANDLLAYVVDHMHALNRELKNTQKELYRAYWNQSGKKLASPKYEEDCSGLLAHDLQNRIRSHNLIVTVEHHMVDNKECDVMVLQGASRLLPIEAKHHFNVNLWTAWRAQLDRLYTRDAAAGGLGVYLVYWSGEGPQRKLPKAPVGVTTKPANAAALQAALEGLIPDKDRVRLKVVVIDISPSPID
jgi:hypothetical protein